MFLNVYGYRCPFSPSHPVPERNATRNCLPGKSAKSAQSILTPVRLACPLHCHAYGALTLTLTLFAPPPVSVPLKPTVPL